MFRDVPDASSKEESEAGKKHKVRNTTSDEEVEAELEKLEEELQAVED